MVLLRGQGAAFCCLATSWPGEPLATRGEHRGCRTGKATGLCFVKPQSCLSLCEYWTSSALQHTCLPAIAIGRQSSRRFSAGLDWGCGGIGSWETSWGAAAQPPSIKLQRFQTELSPFSHWKSWAAGEGLFLGKTSWGAAAQTPFVKLQRLRTGLSPFS